MAAKRLTSLSVNHLLHGYRIKRITDVPEFKLTAVELLHEKTQAKHLHLARDDPNKTFSVQFRTTPKDSTGVAHILEHTVLCGSERYPVRDPFFKMLNRSLSTFMNAFTASDWTMYPFSTLNEKDFQNLLSVYMDAVLKPRLTEHDFMQEGWHLEHSDLTNKASPLIFKGVVYNEMKGVFSSSENLFAQTLENSLKPSTYGEVSGGDPARIPDLTWAKLKQFHETYYHPSNARFYTYGDMEMDKYLQILNENYLQHYTVKKVDSAVPLEPKWPKPRDTVIHCSPDPMAADISRQNTIAISFALDDIRESYTNFLLFVVSRLLLEGDNAPLFRALLEPGLGQGWSGAAHGYDPTARTTGFAVGLQGVHEDRLAEVGEAVETVFKEAARDGFPEDRVEATLHQIELSVKHDKSNFGLQLILGLSYALNHDANPESAIQITRHVDQFKRDLQQNPDLLKDLVKKYFLDNPHKLTVTMVPKAEYETEVTEKEAANLARLTADLTEEHRDNLLEKALKLQSLQDQEEDLSCLPCLQIDDISSSIVPEPFTILSVQGSSVQLNEAPTNGLTYLSMILDLQDLPSHLLSYVPLFASLITKLGADGLSYREISRQQELYTGGLAASPHIAAHPANLMDHQQGLALGGFSLQANLPRMLDLWTRIFLAPDFTDAERLATLVRMELSESWSADVISSTGHGFAMRRAAGVLSPAGRISELWSGLEQAGFIKRAVERLDKSVFDNDINLLRELAQIVLTRQRIKLSLTSDGEGLKEGINNVSKFLSAIPSGETSQMSSSSIPPLSRQCHFVMPFSVNYSGLACTTVPYTSPYFPSFRVLGKLLTNKFLHKQIREKGGAYGGGAAARAGHMLFYSYRDPQSMATMETFAESVEWARTTKFTDQDLMEGKLAVFQELDRPVSAGNRGNTHFSSGIDDDMRQQHRDHLFSVTADDLTRAAEKINLKEAGRVLIGPENETSASSKEWDNASF